MPIAGRQLSIGWALALCHSVGFKGRNLNVAVAVMTAESGRYVGAWHDNLNEAGEVDSTDRGLFQINSKWHPDFSEEDAYKCIPNATVAFEMSSGKHFSPWMAYVNGAHKKYLPPVFAVKALGLWRGKVKRLGELP